MSLRELMRKRAPVSGAFTLLIMLLFAVLAVTTFAKKRAQTTAQKPSPALPSPGSKNSPNTLRFCLYGDTRDGHDAHRKVIAVMMKQNPEFILQTGDLVHNGGVASQWETYDAITGEARQKAPFYIVRGNHDFGGKGFEDRVTAPYTSGNKFYYSFDKANCHFIGLAIDEKTPYDENSAQYKWLIQDLDKTLTTKPTHIFVFFHVAPFSIGSHGSDLDVRKTLHPVFKKYGVRAVFNGHDHLYYRTQRDGITYMVSGGGGAPLYSADPEKGAISGDKYESVNHCVVCEVTGKLVAFTALRADGSQLDRFSLRAE